MTLSTPSIPTVRARHESFLHDEPEDVLDAKLRQTRVKRNIISGAFGAVREAMGGSRKRDGR